MLGSPVQGHDSWRKLREVSRPSVKGDEDVLVLMVAPKADERKRYLVANWIFVMLILCDQRDRHWYGFGPFQSGIVSTSEANFDFLTVRATATIII